MFGDLVPEPGSGEIGPGLPAAATLRRIRSQRVPQDAGDKPFMSSSEQPCPIWNQLPHVRSIPEHGRIWGTNRTVGPFLPMRAGADLLQGLTDRQKANLSHWLDEYNLRHRMFDNSSWQSGNLLELDEAWVVDHRDLTPSTSNRMLMLLRELIRCDDAGLEPTADLQLAAGGCRNDPGPGGANQTCPGTRLNVPRTVQKHGQWHH